jgi:hypothetical protein
LYTFCHRLHGHNVSQYLKRKEGRLTNQDVDELAAVGGGHLEGPAAASKHFNDKERKKERKKDVFEFENRGEETK